jgi:hypothetical protein
MRHGLSAYLCVLVLCGCGGGATDDATAASGTASPAQKPVKSSGLVGVEAKARCGGFGAAQAAEILGVAASAVTATSQDVTPTTRGCEFSAGGKKISFSLTVEASIDDAKRDFESLRETYVIAARAQESATGKTIPEGAYSDILSVGDEGVWSVTNGAMAVRYKNLKIMVLAPSEKRLQAAVAAKIIEGL